MKELYIAGIDWESIADGLGMRVTVFLSGCDHHCDGCHNKESWDYNYGIPFSRSIENKIFTAVKKDYIDGITLSGGCPMCNATALLPFVKKFKKKFPTKNIWCFCGETINGILAYKSSDQYKLLEMVDVLVDGPFELSARSTTIPYRGSSNQRVIDVKATLESSHIVELDLK